MTTGKVDDLVAALVTAITQSGRDEGLRGSRAGQILRRVDPLFSPQAYGVKSMTEFIAKFAPQVRPLRRDPDWVYGLVEWTGPVHTSVDFWRTWVSPSSPNVLVIHRSTGEVHAAPKGSSTDPAMLIIAPAEQDVHRRVARTFVDSLAEVSESSRESLRELTQQASSEWWKGWSREILRMSREGELRWRRYRVAALATELRTRLESALSSAAATAAFRAIAGTRRDLAPDTMPKLEQREKAVPRGTLGGFNQEQLVDVVTRVIRRMTVDDLRALTLPLGLVLDVLAERA